MKEARCYLKGSTVDFGEIPVSDPKNKFVHLKNAHKNPVVFKVVEPLPRCITVEPLSGRIGPDGYTEFRVMFYSRTETLVKDDILIDIRGGR